MRKMIAAALLKYVPVMLIFAPLTACGPRPQHQDKSAAQVVAETNRIPATQMREVSSVPQKDQCDLEQEHYEKIFGTPPPDWKAALKEPEPQICDDVSRALDASDLLHGHPASCSFPLPEDNVRRNVAALQVKAAQEIFAALKSNTLFECSKLANEGEYGLSDPSVAVGIATDLLVSAKATPEEAGFSTDALRTAFVKTALAQLPKLHKELQGDDNDKGRAAHELSNFLDAGIKESDLALTPSDVKIMTDFGGH